jgi:alanine-glyoxylate transaminase/serine-glyoxylate transaminase/serine-pyruvate transaminase
MPTPSTPKPRGRHFFANPGPTNIPDSVLRAMDRGSIDFNDPEFVPVYEAAFAGVKRVLRTDQHLFMYNASGHGAWEASLTNLLSPGDTVLVLESGYFSEEWAAMARGHGLEVRVESTSPMSARRWPPTPRTPSRRSAWSTMRRRPA